MQTRILLLAACSVAFSQPPAQTPANTPASLPQFEVASVKLTQHGRDANGWSHSSIDIPNPGSFIATNSSMEECIRWAYNVKDYQVSGPDWLNSDEASYDIAAKTGDRATTREVRQMLQSLLAQRFHLALHRETRMLPMYELVVAKGGSKITPSASGKNDGGINSKGGNVEATSVSMPFFAETLATYIKTPVIDKTGLTGNFDFKFEYAPNERDISSAPSIFTALPDKLGLKLQSVKGPVEVLVIDRVEKVPSEN